MARSKKVMATMKETHRAWAVIDGSGLVYSVHFTGPSAWSAMRTYRENMRGLGERFRVARVKLTEITK